MATTHEWISHDAPSVRAPANQFMPQNQRWKPQSAVPQKPRNIGAADSRHFDGDFFLPLLRFRTGTLFQFDPSGSGIDQGLHGPKYKAASGP